MLARGARGAKIRRRSMEQMLQQLLTLQELVKTQVKATTDSSEFHH